MYNKLSRAMKSRKGFTLVELMVVVVIIGILVAVAVPVYNNVTTNAQENSHNANVRILEGAAAQWIAENGAPAAATTWNATTNAAAWGSYLVGWPTNPLPAAHAQAGAYSVAITTAGGITVTPARAP